jgi:acyl-CoA synthetase (NDP forming)
MVGVKPFPDRAMSTSMNEQLASFFSPKKIAVIGASEKNQWFANLLENARKANFDGVFYPVNPRAASVCGRAAIPAIDALPRDVDFAVIMVNSRLVLETLRALAGRNIKNILLISSGFSENPGEGERLQEEVRGFCLAEDIALVGPNCLGFINLADRASVFGGGSVEGEAVAGDIGLVSQSGASLEVLATKMFRKGLGLSLMVSSGNEAVISFEDCLEHLVNHGKTRVIAAFIEGFRNPEALKRIALEAAERGIPIVAIKVGGSIKGSVAARSHTGAMAGNDRVADSFMRQYGIVRAHSIEEMVETVGIFSRCTVPSGGGLALCTLSGGLAGMYADICSSLSVDVPDLSPATIEALRAALPEFANPANPLDVTGQGFYFGMETVARILLDDRNIDVLATLSFPPEKEGDIYSLHNEYILKAAAMTNKPVIPLTFREVSPYARQYYRDKGLYFIEHATDGFRAVANLIGYARFAKRIKG